MSDAEKGPEAIAAEDLDDNVALLSKLELERKASAGKDKRITQNEKELQALRSELEKARGEASAAGWEHTAQGRKLLEAAVSLKAREEDLAAKEQALAAAIEKKLPISLVLRGTADLDGWIKELEGFRAEAVESERRASDARRPITGPPGYGPPKLEHIRKMKASEIAKIPESILRRLEQQL